MVTSCSNVETAGYLSEMCSVSSIPTLFVGLTPELLLYKKQSRLGTVYHLNHIMRDNSGNLICHSCCYNKNSVTLLLGESEVALFPACSDLQSLILALCKCRRGRPGRSGHVQ